jgi:hypothetical protein
MLTTTRPHHTSARSAASSVRISNRHLVKLKCDVTPTKQTTAAFLIGNRRTFFQPWSSESSLRNQSPSTMRCASTLPAPRSAKRLGLRSLATAVPTSALSRITHAPSEQPTCTCAPLISASALALAFASHVFPGVRQIAPATCRSATQPIPSTTSSRNSPTSRRRASVTVGQRSALTRQLLTSFVDPVATQLIISNRSVRRLETSVTHSKHSPRPRSNRHKFRHKIPTCPPTWFDDAPTLH